MAPAGKMSSKPAPNRRSRPCRALQGGAGWMQRQAGGGHQSWQAQTQPGQHSTTCPPMKPMPMAPRWQGRRVCALSAASQSALWKPHRKVSTSKLGTPLGAVVVLALLAPLRQWQQSRLLGLAARRWKQAARRQGGAGHLGAAIQARGVYAHTHLAATAAALAALHCRRRRRCCRCFRPVLALRGRLPGCPARALLQLLSPFLPEQALWVLASFEQGGLGASLPSAALLLGRLPAASGSGSGLRGALIGAGPPALARVLLGMLRGALLGCRGGACHGLRVDTMPTPVPG
jgi:hypothetical protein